MHVRIARRCVKRERFLVRRADDDELAGELEYPVLIRRGGGFDESGGLWQRATGRFVALDHLLNVPLLSALSGAVRGWSWFRRRGWRGRGCRRRLRGWCRGCHRRGLLGWRRCRRF